MNRVAARWLIALAMIAALACRDRGSARSARQAAESADLEGAWEVELQLERPVALVTEKPGPPRDLRGHFAFVRNDSRRDRYPTIGIPDYFGTYQIDFVSFGFSPSTRRDLPSAVAKVYGRDSVLIALDPTEAEVTVILRGAMRADSLIGTWTVSSRRVGGGGSYVMRRASRRRANP
jgi:hypothetical protein